MNFLKNTEDIQESLGNGGSRDQYRDKKHKDEDAQAGQAKKLALSDGLHIINTRPSPAPSRNSSRSDQSGVMTSLSVKKLDHEIRKTDIELIKNLSQTLAEKVVCQPPRATPCVS